MGPIGNKRLFWSWLGAKEAVVKPLAEPMLTMLWVEWTDYMETFLVLWSFDCDPQSMISIIGWNERLFPWQVYRRWMYWFDSLQHIQL